MRTILTLVFVLIALNCNAQWIHTSSKFASKFLIIENRLFVCTENGLLYFNEDSSVWVKTRINGGINNFCFYNKNFYCILGGKSILRLKENQDVDTIELGIELKEEEKLRFINAFDNKLFISTTKKTFRFDITNKNIVQIKTDNSLPAISGIKNVLNYHGKLICLANNGIYISEDKLNYTLLIKNDQFSDKIEFITNIDNFNDLLYVIANSHIYFTNDLEKWERYDNFEKRYSFHRICPLNCNGVLIGGLGIAYSYDGTNINHIPWITKDSNEIAAVNDIIVFKNKIFVSAIVNSKNGIWFTKYDVQLKF